MDTLNYEDLKVIRQVNSKNITRSFKGAGAVDSGIAGCLFKAGFQRCSTLEREKTPAVRRPTRFRAAVYGGSCCVEGVEAHQLAQFSKIGEYFYGAVIGDRVLVLLRVAVQNLIILHPAAR